jgi:hypothetical protein
MELQPIINVVGGAILAGMGWFARQLWEAVQELRRDLHQIEVDLPNHYVKKVEYAADVLEVKQLLQKIFDKLDTKADKP